MARPVKYPLRTPPLILCVDNSTMYSSLAIISSSGCICEHSLISRITHSKRLLTEMKVIMEECELNWNDLDGLAISLGPGSFTGLRIGLTTIKGICLATGLPLMGISSLESLARQIPFCALPICPILDARKQEVYTALYQTGLKGMTPLMEPAVLSMDKLTALIKTATLFMGDGVAVYQEELKEQLGDLAHFAPPQLIFPRASALGQTALKQFQAGQFLDPATASPLYIRPSDAEVNLKKAQNLL